ncbi:hypothetical protein PF011_g17491 [Phytophthora fragariae]|uniref:Uncharacterized protein n=1 Tax=Phytophthora fragariae TaxID=53985 RepID=A0A6A3JEF7_9STRA|nr:hypothetical protein PF011_g17491 [Phytophthora fragariae]
MIADLREFIESTDLNSENGIDSIRIQARLLWITPETVRNRRFLRLSELSGSFDCVFVIPWLARHQPAIDWLAGTVRPRDIDVNAVEAFLCGTPNQWPHVSVMDPDSMTHAAPEESDGPSCAVCEYATCAGPEQESQDASDVVEHGFPRPDEQRFSEEDDDDVVEHGFPRPDEQWFSPGEDDDVVERGLPLAVEHGFPRVVERCNGARIGQCPFQGKGMFSDVDHTDRCGPQELSVTHHDGYCVPVVLI